MSVEGLEHFSKDQLIEELINRQTFVGITEQTNGSGMGFPIHMDHPPLRLDEGGVVRVGKSRISLDLIVEQYENGMTPEEFVHAYDSLTLAEVYAVIGYYLRHRDDVDAYLRRRTLQVDALRAKIETERPRVGRDELLARRKTAENANAPARQ